MIFNMNNYQKQKEKSENFNAKYFLFLNQIKKQDFFKNFKLL